MQYRCSNEQVHDAVQEKRAWFKSPQCPEKGGKDGWSQGDKANLRRTMMNSPQYLQMVMMFSESQNGWAAQSTTPLVRISYAIALVGWNSLKKTTWRHGLSAILGCSMSSLSGQVMSSPRSLQLPASSQCDHDSDPQSTRQDEIQEGCWSIWYHSWDDESCWCEMSWANEATGGGCF